MRVIYPCVYALARCQRSQLPLFQDFYNWGEAVSRINAPTEGRVGQLFNGIVITRCQAEVLPCALSLILFLSHPRISLFCHLPLFYRSVLRIFCFLSRWSLLACRLRYILIFSFLSFMFFYFSFLAFSCLVVVRQFFIIVVFQQSYITLNFQCVYENKYKILPLYMS